MYEIYSESIRDLLNPDQQGGAVCDVSVNAKHGVYIEVIFILRFYLRFYANNYFE